MKRRASQRQEREGIDASVPLQENFQEVGLDVLFPMKHEA
jgi:hypothetical protein